MSRDGQRHPLGRNCQVALLLLPFTVAQVVFAGWRKKKRSPSKPPRKPYGSQPLNAADAYRPR